MPTGALTKLKLKVTSRVLDHPSVPLRKFRRPRMLHHRSKSHSTLSHTYHLRRHVCKLRCFCRGLTRPSHGRTKKENISVDRNQ